MPYPNPTWEIDSRSNFLISNSLALTLPPQALLLSFFPELSSTWCSAYLLKENGCKKTLRNSWRWSSEEDDSTHHVWNYLQSAFQRFVFCCQRVWIGDFVVQIDLLKQPIQRHSVGSGHVSHREPSALYDHELEVQPIPVLSATQVPWKPLRIVFPITMQPMDDHFSFVQEVPRDLQRFPTIWATCVVEDVSGHSDFEILSNLGAPSICTWVYADTASAACPSQPGGLAMSSITFAAVVWDADEPCSVKLHWLQSHPSQCLPEHDSASVLLQFGL